MLNILKSIPQKTIAGIVTGITVYCFVKGYIGSDEVILIVTVMGAFGISIEGATKAL